LGRHESAAFVEKCIAFKSGSVLAVDAAAIKIGARTTIGRNLLGDVLKRLRGIEALIALDGTIRFRRQILVRTCLGATRAFKKVEFCLAEVHERTLAHETPHTANRLVDYCINLTRIQSSSSSSSAATADPTSNTDFSREEYQYSRGSLGGGV
jgi:hypothetical protein